LNIFGNRAYEDGFNVYTTLDSEMQKNAVESVRKNLYIYQDRYGWKENDVITDLNFQVLKSYFDKNSLFFVSANLNFSQVLEDNLQKIQTILTDSKSYDSAEPGLVVLTDEKEAIVVDKELNSFKLEWRDEYLKIIAGQSH
jgi:membrane carboxypeptidase/penicillin-binding protein